MKKNFLVILTLTIIGAMVIATTPGVFALVVEKQFDGKGAIGQWVIDGGSGGPHTINAVVDMSNSGKDGKIYVSVVHPVKGISEASGPVDFKWNLNHVLVEATLTFTGPGRNGTHKVTISWLTSGSTSNKPLEVNTANGLSLSINGAWKLGVAELSIDPTATTGHHQNSVYSSSWAVVVHGNADLLFTT